MNIAVFDCPQGIAGDMTVGALIDAGVPFAYLKRNLKKIIRNGYRVNFEKTRSGAFRAAKFSVTLTRTPRHHTSLREIETVISKSKIPAAAKQWAKAIFRRLGHAEARVHGVGLQKIHFHEAGAVDSILDIAGTALALDYLKIKRAYLRHLSVGRGTIQGAHGRMPVPVPGAYELLKGFELTQTDHAGEMVTPTGAAILAAVCRKKGKIPKVRIAKIGYGAGDRMINGSRGLLRVSIGTA